MGDEKDPNKGIKGVIDIDDDDDDDFGSMMFKGSSSSTGKVEKILKGSLNLIPSPSLKIQILGGKVCLRSKGKTLMVVVNF